ncbi:MAG: HD domain-containing protein [Actinomycetota bacterium]|nr:HD domain-containing protein [Actinomycetota bacterium]
MNRARLEVVATKLGIILIGFGLFGYYLLTFSLQNLIPIIFFVLCVAVAEYFDVTLPQGGSVSVSSAIILSALFLFPLPQAMVVALVGVLLGGLVRRRLRGEIVPTGDIILPLAQISIVVPVTAAIFHLFGGEIGKIDLFRDAIPLFGACLTYFFTEVSLDQLVFSFKRGISFFSSWVGTVQLLGLTYIASFTTATLVALLYRAMSFWSAPLFLLPLLVTRYSFKLYLDIKRTYYDTIKALTAAMESQDPNRLGHAERVANYSFDIARELGIRGRQLELVGYAAFLHDIGKVGIEEGTLDSVLELAEARRGEASHSEMGADILEQVEFFRDASDIVRKHHHLFDDGSKSPEKDIPIGSRIINLASYFDELTQMELPEKRLTPHQAMMRIKKEQGLRFDPKVVRAFANVLRRQRKLLTAV